MGRWTGRHRRACQMAVSLLILALLPAPLPKVEFHNVRHHDDPGQLCEYHDHLLRWHPDATGAADVAVLHWHWAWPSQNPSTETGHDGGGLRVHAHLLADALPDAGVSPAIVVDTSPRSLSVALSQPPSLAFAFAPPTGDLLPLRSGTPPALTFGATFAPGLRSRPASTAGPASFFHLGPIAFAVPGFGR